MSYYSDLSPGRLRVIAIFTPLFSLILLIVFVVCYDSLVATLITSFIFVYLCIVGIAIWRSARHVFLKITDSELSWSSILTDPPEALIQLSQISKIEFRDDMYAGDSPPPEVYITLMNNEEYLVPIPDDRPRVFFNALVLACPSAVYQETQGRLSNSFMLILKTVFSKKIYMQNNWKQTNQIPILRFVEVYLLRS